MQVKKEKFLDKIVKKDYNNELEKILEKKEFDEDAKSILLSILYKIEAAYKDVETVKGNVEDKEQYVQEFIEIIKNTCNSIKIVKMTDGNNILENKTYVINKEEGEIIAYPIERKILYAIYKLSNKDLIIKDEYYLINETISDLINIGNNINMVEPLRDFNGYSWSTIAGEIESIDHNLVYQNLRILVGEKFLKRWIKNEEFIIDYFDLLKERLKKKYSKELQEKIIENISKISILLEIKNNQDNKEKYLKDKEIIEKEVEKIKNKGEFIKSITKEKLEITNEIKKIDTIVNNKKLLEEEYKRRNENLSLDKKIFSMRILSQIMEEDRNEKFKKIEELNEILKPQNFVKYSKELENKYKYLKIIEIEKKDKEIEKLKSEIQKDFLEAVNIKVKKIQTKAEMKRMIYDFRYYEMLPYNLETQIKEQNNIQKKIQETEKLILGKAIELKVIEKISREEKTNFEILRNIFTTKIINLGDAYLKIIKEKDKYFVQIFDENIFEEKIEISKPNDLLIKMNKKISICS